MRRGSLITQVVIGAHLYFVLSVRFKIIQAEFPEQNVLEQYGRVLQLLGEVFNFESDPIGAACWRWVVCVQRQLVSADRPLDCDTRWVFLQLDKAIDAQGVHVTRTTEYND